jgi:predicted DNA-binding mobile mystery protein A
MKPEFRSLRLKQLERSLQPFQEAKSVQRPERGWIRAVRQALGTSLAEMAGALGSSNRQLALQLEKSEAESRISLKSLTAAAEALGCELVYALVPKQGNFHDLAKARAGVIAKRNVLAVEHTMALENQATGRIKERIDEETERILNTRSKR